MKLTHTIIYVRSVEKTCEFYAEAFGLTKGFMTPEGDYGEMETGETKLSFASVELAHQNLPGGFRENRADELPSGFEVAFEVEDVQEAWNIAIRAGATPYGKPTQKPWGQITGYVRDPEGLLIELGSRIEKP